MIRYYLLFTFLILIAFTSHSIAEDSVVVPESKDYMVEPLEYLPAETLDITEYEDKFYKNILLKEYQNEPNLSQKYLVIEVTCGANCKTNFIANKETGKIIGNIGTTLNLEYNIDNALLIADKYTLPLEKPFYQNPIAGNVRFYIIKDDSVELISQLSQQDYYNIKKSDLNNAD